MSKKSFKVKNSILLQETSRQSDSEASEIYYDSVKKSFATKADFWSFLAARVDVEYTDDMTSTTLTSSVSENSILRITGSPAGAFNIHGLAMNNDAKMLFIFNDTNQKMVFKHLSTTELVPSARIKTPKSTDLSIAKKSLAILYFDGLASNWVVTQASGGSGGTSFDQIQPAHGFSVLTPIYHDGVEWKAAQANASNTLATYVVTEISTNAFTATKFGVVEVPSHGLTVGEFYYTATDTAGGITSTEPLFGYSNPVLYVQDTLNIHLMVHRPSLIGDGSVSDSEIGAVLAFPSLVEPVGFLYCDGRAVSRVTYSELFNKIGTSHGTGDGSTTFNLPDYRGYFLRGLDGTANRDPDKASRTAMNTGGNTGNNIGSVQDDSFESHTHIQDSHNHVLPLTVQVSSGGTFSHVGGGSETYVTNPATNSTIATNQNTGGNETRPKNAYVGYFIRYSAKGAIKGKDLPAGVVLPFGGAPVSLPNGYLLCDGSSLNRSDYPELFAAIGTAWGSASGTTFNLPDTRGLFLRGVDGVANRDPDKASRTAIATGGNTGNNVGSFQDDAFESHFHGDRYLAVAGAGPTGYSGQTGTISPLGSSSTGGNETRPKNVYVNYIIKY